MKAGRYKGGGRTGRGSKRAKDGDGKGWQRHDGNGLPDGSSVLTGAAFGCTLFVGCRVMVHPEAQLTI